MLFESFPIVIRDSNLIFSTVPEKEKMGSIDPEKTITCPKRAPK